MAHTSGPWVYEYGMVYTLIGIPIAKMVRDTPETSPTERDDNGCLIAAAPELLEALKAMLNIFDRGLPENSIGERNCNQAKAAIQKAEGREGR